MRKTWIALCNDVLSFKYEKKIPQETVVDLVGNMTSLRYATSKVVSGSKPVGFTYWHFENLFVNAIRAADQGGFMVDLKSRSRNGDIFSIIQRLTTDGINPITLQEVINYAAYCMAQSEIKLSTICRRVSSSVHYLYGGTEAEDDEDEDEE